MNDGLEYIREAIRLKGKNVQVEVVRWEKDAKSGYYNQPFTVLMPAQHALNELLVPYNKRSRNWKMIRPLGVAVDGTVLQKTDTNSLSDPQLIERLRADIEKSVREQIQAELSAKAIAEATEKPKKSKKSEEIEMPDSLLDQVNNES